MILFQDCLRKDIQDNQDMNIPWSLQLVAKGRGKASVQDEVLGMILAGSIEEHTLGYMMDWEGA